tara:strand:- start:4814 stop:5374 length:561 start_codon:yes stop_codon:yes gene_type:complete
MTSKKEIMVGDIVLAGCNNSRAKVVEVDNNSPYPYTVQYFNTAGAGLTGREYFYATVTFVSREEAPEQLYTIHGGTAPWRKVGECGEYFWMEPINPSLSVPITFNKSSVHEIKPVVFLKCSMANGPDVYKKAYVNSFIKKGQSFLTKAGNVITVKEISTKSFPFAPQELMDENKIVFLEGQQIKFV